MKIEDLNKNDKIVLAQNTTSRELLNELAKENDEDIYKLLARNENTPLEVLKILSFNDMYKDALNENYSFKKYDKLMNDENFSKMSPIKQETIIKMFRMIKNKEEISIIQYDVFMRMDYNPLLDKIAFYEKTPIEVLNKLYDLKPNIDVCSFLENPNCPQNILEEIYKNKNKYLNLKDEYLNFIIVNNPNCPQNALEELSKNENKNVLTSIAGNPNTPIKILEQLANHENEDVKIFLVCNKNCSKEILEKLSKDESLNVKDYISIHPNVTREILENMSNEPNNHKELIERCNRFIKRLDKKEQSNNYDFEM